MIVNIVRSERGAALITGLMVFMIVAIFGMTYLGMTTTNLIRASRDERHATAFYLADGALEYILGEVMTYAETHNGTIQSQTFDSTSMLNAEVAGATGTVTITADAGNSSMGIVVSSATYRGITETVRVRVKTRDVGIWNNAIFGGIGQSGRGINGNVDIRGSVHILGEGDPFSDLNGNGRRDVAETYTDSNGNGQYDSGESFTDADGNGLWSSTEPYQDNNLNGAYDPPLTATELAADISGGAQIGNNYTGIPTGLQAKIPALSPVSIDGETVTTLNSEVRIKHGKMNLSGTATAGKANVTGNTVKETLDGVYISDGYGGNQGSSNVFADNGTANGYDLGNRIAFPSLLSPFRDPVMGLNYSTYETYLDVNSYLPPAVITKIDSLTENFSYSQGSNSISWDKATLTLTINGIIRLPGDLDLGTKDGTIYFAGRGTLFCKNDVKVHGNVLPKTTFPTVDTIGVIAKRDIQFATGSGESQLSAAGAWYAQRKIMSAKQNSFAGTYVSDYFDMGTNVPSIYQTPSLKDNLPPGMPGSEPIYITQIMSWRRM